MIEKRATVQRTEHTISSVIRSSGGNDLVALNYNEHKAKEGPLTTDKPWSVIKEFAATIRGHQKI